MTTKYAGAKTKKKVRKNIQSGTAHIQATFNNTIVTISDLQGNEQLKMQVVKLPIMVFVQ